jgi:predicted Zn-ribbon and HTH transcriptional regulator
MAVAILVAHFRQSTEQATSTRAQSVDSKIETLTAALRKIRDHADAALKDVEPAGKERKALGWKCADCGHIKHFTRPVPVEVAVPCPKCRGETFEPR